MKYYFLITFSLLLSFNNSIAQEVYSVSNSKLVKQFEEAITLFQDGKPDDAIKLTDKIIKAEPNFYEVYALRGEIYIEMNDLNNAMESFKQAIGINPRADSRLYFQAGELHLMAGKYEDSKRYYEQYLTFSSITPEMKDRAKKEIINCDFAITALKNPVPFNPINMGPEINSFDYEYFPAVTADDQMLLFTRNQRDAQTGRMMQEDFYVSRRSGPGWSDAQNLGQPINSPGNEGAPTLSADGQILIFTACDRPNGAGSCDIYFARKNGNKWSSARNIGPPINTKAWETQPSFSSDGRTLYFIRAITDVNGKRDQDIYVSELTDKGVWGSPLPLNRKINTPGREESVFIHPDNQTLYFSSDGHPGMGGLDIYYCKRQPDGTWGDPKNIGYPINTQNDEGSILVGPTGDIAYFASDREGGYGGLDLYKFDLYPAARPEKINYVKGKVYNKNTKEPLEAHFELIDLETAKTKIESESNPGNGEFLLTLPVNKDYALNVSKAGYMFYSESFSLKNITDVSKPFLLDVPLIPIDTGATVELKNVFFETNKFDLKPESKAELNKLVSFLKQNENLKIELEGHTDNTGDKKANQLLSQNRAKAVYDYLIANGIVKERLSYKGYGDSKPKAPNDTAENKAKNRRTEFKVTGK